MNHRFFAALAALVVVLLALPNTTTGQEMKKEKKGEMMKAHYLIELSHTPEECLADLDAFAVYLSLTNMRGRYSIDLRWLHGDTEDELARISETEPFDVADPLSRLEIVVLGNLLPIPEPGRYVLRLSINGRHVHDCVMIAREAFE